MNKLIELQLKSAVSNAEQALLNSNAKKFESLKAELEKAKNNLSYFYEHSETSVITLSTSVRNIFESSYSYIAEEKYISEYNLKAETYNRTSEGRKEPMQEISDMFASNMRMKIEKLGSEISSAVGIVRLGLVGKYKELCTLYNMVHGEVWNTEISDFSFYLEK